MTDLTTSLQKGEYLLAYTEAIALITTALGVAEGRVPAEVLPFHIQDLFTELTELDLAHVVFVISEYAAHAVALVADVSGQEAAELHRNIALTLAEHIHLPPEERT